jgi:hypothetical protein
MTKQSKRKPKTKQKPNVSIEEQRQRDLDAFAELLYDIYEEQKHKEADILAVEKSNKI